MLCNGTVHYASRKHNSVRTKNIHNADPRPSHNLISSNTDNLIHLTMEALQGLSANGRSK